MVRRSVDVAGMAVEKLLPPAPAMDKESLIARFGEDGLEEMRDMAEGAGIPLEALVRHNVCLFPTQDTSAQKKLYNAGKSVHASSTNPNSVKMNSQSLERVASGCVQFAGTTPNGAFIHGCNIDLPFKRIVPDSIQVLPESLRIRIVGDNSGSNKFFCIHFPYLLIAQTLRQHTVHQRRASAVRRISGIF